MLEGHRDVVMNVAFDPSGQALATASADHTVKLWEPDGGKLLHTLEKHTDKVNGVAFAPSGRMLASSSWDNTIKLWERDSGRLLQTLVGHSNWVNGVAFDPSGRMLASGSDDHTVKVWEPSSAKLLCTLEGHTGPIGRVVFNADGSLLASTSADGSIRLWRCDTWEHVASLPRLGSSGICILGLAFHPRLPVLAAASAWPDTSEEARCKFTHLYELDLGLLLGKASGAKPPARAVHHTTAKIVLVGDSGVGKTGLGWRLAHGEFKEHSSTHGQQFWVLPQLALTRKDGTQCEAILWDLAGQPDYRLIHALFLDDADLALVLFDAADIRDPLHGVEFWLKQLSSCGQAGRYKARCPILLIGARVDRGSSTLTSGDLETFCRQRGLSGYINTSALTGEGLEELVQRIKDLIPWDDKPVTVTTAAFKRIKECVLEEKENHRRDRVITNVPAFYNRLHRKNIGLHLLQEDMMTAIGHLENYGYVKRLHTSKGEERILLVPELLNNLAASFVLEARRNPKGLGALEERRLLTGGYPFHELEGLTHDEQDILLDSAALLFIEHHVCFRETDPSTQQSYLVFPGGSCQAF